MRCTPYRNSSHNFRERQAHRLWNRKCSSFTLVSRETISKWSSLISEWEIKYHISFQHKWRSCWFFVQIKQRQDWLDLPWKRIYAGFKVYSDLIVFTILKKSVKEKNMFFLKETELEILLIFWLKALILTL